MKNLLFISILFLAFVANGQETKINLENLAKSGSNNTILRTDASGNVSWDAYNAIFTGGTGVSVSALGVISNDSPDQVVSLTGAGIANVTGTYPNFTITATESDGDDENEAQQFSVSGTSTVAVQLSDIGGVTGGTFSITGGGGTSVSRVGNDITITSTAVGANIDIARFELIVPSSGNTVAVTGFTPDETSTMVFVDGVHMDIGTGEDATLSGSTYTFSSNLEAGQKVLVKKFTIQ